ncbi:hypothetical protein [Streptomyces sp. NPDC054887]
MADERYEWLDKDAAERLLRGEPVGPVGDHARAQAERLAAALDGVARAGGHESGELPGEAAALAAFRKARAAAPENPTVRIGRAAPVGLRWARPVRIGLAGALAGVALGGVAVAAGTGVLPSPFGTGDRPAPAATVSAAATPPPPAPGTTGPGHDGTGGPSPDGTGTPGDAHGTPDDGGTGDTHESSAGPGTATPPTSPTRPGDGAPGTGGDGPVPGSDDWYRETVRACRDHRSGSLAPDHERRLEEAARGADRVERFCDHLLDGSDGRDGPDDGSADGGRNGGRDEDGRHGDGRKGRTGDGEAADGRGGATDGVRRRVPAVSYTPPPSPATGSVAPVTALTQAD